MWLALALLAIAPRPAAAQVRGVPLALGEVANGVSAGMELAFPNDALGGGAAFGLAAAVGAGRLAAVATGALVDYDTDAMRVGFGLRGELLLARSSTSPFQLLAFTGAGYMERDAGDEWRIPVGASFAFRSPTPFGTFVSWLAARGQYVSFAGDDGLFAGLGGGLDLTWTRLGLHAAYDRLLRPGADEATFGLGVTYTFTSRF